MQLFRPTPAMKDAFLDYQSDWETHGEPVAPGAARLGGRTYETWLADTWALETKPRGSYVTGHTYFAFDGDGVLVGVIALRHTLNDYLLKAGGHIGYGVRPSARRRGHASAMLAAVLPLAAALGLTRVLITCDKQNIGSARAILRNGGILENEAEDSGRILQRYWVAL
ncbi:MAG: GNAT family N-acetyltransferase [Bacillota bacterium]